MDEMDENESKAQRDASRSGRLYTVYNHNVQNV